MCSFIKVFFHHMALNAQIKKVKTLTSFSVVWLVFYFSCQGIKPLHYFYLVCDFKVNRYFFFRLQHVILYILEDYKNMF